MKLSCKAAPTDKQQKTCLLLGVFDDGKLTPSAKAVDKDLAGHITNLIKRNAFTGKTGQTLPIYLPNVAPILLVGCGQANALTPTGFRKIVTCAIKALNATKASAATCYLSELIVGNKLLAWKVKQIAEATWDALYCFDVFKSEKEPSKLQEFIIHNPEAKQQKACDLALKQGQAIAIGMILTKNLANTPSNICTPSFLAEQAKDLAKSYAAISIKVLEEKDMRKLGMGAILAVRKAVLKTPNSFVSNIKAAKKTSACCSYW